MSSSLKLGVSADLLFGYRPTWDPNDPSTAAPFFVPPVPPLEPQTPDPVPDPYNEWTNTPTITIHETPEELLSAIYDYRVARMSNDPAGAEVPVGPLALDDSDRAAALQAAADFLGLDLSAGYSYMLVTMQRISGRATHDFSANPSAQHRTSYLTPAAAAIIDQLTPAPAPKPGEVLSNVKISKADADQYLDAIYQIGSHFVSGMVLGDRLIQVFAYNAKVFKVIQKEFKADATTQPDGSLAVTGPTASNWAYFTSPSSSDYGFVSSYGSLVCISRDSALKTAIANGDWANDYVPQGTPSIFAAASHYKLMQPLSQDVPIGLTLTPVAELIANSLISGPWNRLVKGGLLQKFGDGILIPLARAVDYDWARIFPETVDSWGSNIVTPQVDIYQERVDLAKVNLQGGSIVSEQFTMHSFTSFSQVLQATTQVGDSPVALPSDCITLVAQIIDMTQAKQTPVLSMSSKGLENLTVVCEEMYGALIFQADDATTGRPIRKTALDGVLFATDAVAEPTTGRSKVSISGVLAEKPSADLVLAQKQSIEFSVVAGESLLHSRGPNAETVRGLEVSYLLWLASIIPADIQDLDLANNRARALYLAHNVATFGTDVVYVPYATYEAYTKYVNDMVSEAKTLTQTISEYQIRITDTVNSFKVMDSIANLNDNVKQLGGVLTSYFKVLSEGRGAMAGYYDSVLAQLDKERRQTLENIASLSKKLSAQQAVISHTGNPQGIVQQFQQDYADYSKDLVAECVVSAVEGLFSLGMSMAAIPGEAEGGVLKALKAIKDVYDKIQALMKVLKSLEKVQKSIDNIDALNTLSNDISSAAGNLKMPSQVDLQSMSINVRAALANVPETGRLRQDKANLIAATDTLVTIGTALLEAQTKASQIEVEIANQNRLKTINGEQQSKLASLTSMLHLHDSTRPPDINSINLIGVTGQLQYQLKQVLSVLARTLELQDGAVQFEYFGNPANITSFSLLNLQTVIATQDNNIINALQQLNPQPQKVPDPITVTVKDVLATRLTGTNVFSFPIQLSSTEFYNYDMVRIERIIPRIKGVKRSDNGNYEVHLSCQGKPFQDRDYDRQARTFATARREFGPYIYDIATGGLSFGGNDGTFADKVTHLTPFTVWEVSLPGNVRNNQGLSFDSLFVDIELEFHITAHYDDPALLLLRQAKRLGLAAAVDSSAPSLANLEAQMYQNQAVLQKWDAVFNVLVGPVNAFLYQQFEQYVKKLDPANTDNLMQVSAYYCDNVEKFRGVWFTNVTKMTFKLSNPLLEFIPGNDSVTVIQDILSGSVVTGTLVVTEEGFDPGKCHLVDQDVDFTVDTGSNTLTLSVDGVFENNMQVKLKTTGTLPAPLQADTDYWIVGWTSSNQTTTLQLSDTAKGAPIAITDAGSGTHTIYADIEWGNPNTVDVSKHPYVKGSVALAKISGIVTPPPGQGSASETHTVILDFPSGAFTLNQFSLNPPDWDPTHHAVNISNALANYFATHEIKYQVQTINYTNLSNDTALQPSKFLLNAQTTNAGNNILQFLIATTGEVQHAHNITLNEPIPYDPANPIPGSSDFSTSLMISTELMFNHIFVDSFNRGGTNLQVAAVDPGKDFEAWSAKVTAGSATGDVPFEDEYRIDGTRTHFRINAGGNSLTWSLVGMTFARSPSGGLLMNYSNGTASPPSGGTEVGFQYQRFVYPPCYQGMCPPGYWGDWHDASAMAYITMDGSYPLSITGEGTQQVVKFANLEPEVTFSKSSDLKPTAACECNDNDLKIALLNGLGDSVPKTLKDYMAQITFKPISVFALENLLFPADQLITMQQARVPGDLLVVGSFLAKVRKKASSYNVTISAAAGAKGEFGGTAFQNGEGTGSATRTGLGKQFNFKYGPIDSAQGGVVDYTIDIEAGTVSPPLMVVVDQPDPDNDPATIVLLPPGYRVSNGG